MKKGRKIRRDKGGKDDEKGDEIKGRKKGRNEN